MNIPPNYQSSPSFQFIASRGWGWKEGTPPNIELETCPYCSKTGYGHFYIEIYGADDPQANRDGLHICHRCGRSGRLYDIKQFLGVAATETTTRKEWGGQERKQEPLPDIDACHQSLLEDEAAMDYLMNGRGFSREIITRQKLGLVPKRYFRECGEVRALVYPYQVNGNCVWVHYRTLPTMPLVENKVPKAFSSPTGLDGTLYNGEILRSGLKEVFMVEGEPNCIAAIDHGITNICGVPGANFKKAEWIKTLDTIGLEKVFICYDKDAVGQKAAQALAARIGIERCWKIILPDFTVTTEEGEVRKGKDLNEWFVSGGGTAEAFQKLKEEAKLFDVEGVSSSHDATQEFLDGLLGKEELEPKYKTGWPSLNRLVGFEDGDVIDILAEEKIGKTTFGLNLMEHMVNEYGEDGVIICLEMTRARMARKWICHLAQIADNIPKSHEESVALAESFKREIPRVQIATANRPGKLYFCYPKYKTEEDIYTLIRDCIRRYGVRWIMLDNLQRLCDTTLGIRNRTQHLSAISKVTSQIAKDYNVQMVRILQPHRIGEGKIVGPSNVDGASQIAKDCDCMIPLHRNRVAHLDVKSFETCSYTEEEQAFENKMLVGVGLSRYSSGGHTTLTYDGATSTVREYNPAEDARRQAEAAHGVGYARQMESLNIKPPGIALPYEGASPAPHEVLPEITI